MMRMDLMSVRLGMASRQPEWRGLGGAGLVVFDHRHEALEEVVAVARAGGGLGVVLHGEHRAAGGGDAVVGAVEQRNVTLDSALGPRRGVDPEAVVLAGDHHLV